MKYLLILLGGLLLNSCSTSDWIAEVHLPSCANSNYVAMWKLTALTINGDTAVATLVCTNGRVEK